MFFTYGKTLNKLIKQSKSDRTWDNYNSKNKAWKTFCNMWKINPLKKHTQDIYCYYAIWRYETTPNKYTSISQDLSAAISLFNSFSFDDKIDRTNFLLLRDIIKGISREEDRQPELTNPIRNLLLLKIVRQYKKFNYMNMLWKCIFTFAKGFALRCSEYTPYTQKPDRRTLKWKHLNFHTYKKQKFLSINIKISKTNKTFRDEILTRECLCSIKKFKEICSVCNLKIFYNLCKLKFKANSNSYVFRRDDGKLVTGAYFRVEFKRALTFVGIKEVKAPFWRPHSLRYGEISDLIAAGVPIEQVRKYARHVPQSETTFRYIQLQTDEEAYIVSNKYKRYYSKNSF